MNCNVIVMSYHEDSSKWEDVKTSDGEKAAFETRREADAWLKENYTPGVRYRTVTVHADKINY